MCREHLIEVDNRCISPDHYFSGEHTCIVVTYPARLSHLRRDVSAPRTESGLFQDWTAPTSRVQFIIGPTAPPHRLPLSARKAAMHLKAD